ncbi:MAG: hypothetical protein HQK54_17935, partial [Oligoflexales bacterium]|nr:hypothetical protein [Oligoflexales bacterium]
MKNKSVSVIAFAVLFANILSIESGSVLLAESFYSYKNNGIWADGFLKEISDEKIQTLFLRKKKKMPVVILDDQSEEVSLAKYTDYLEDPKSELDIFGLLNAEQGGLKWNASRVDKVPSFGYTDSSYWLRYLIENRGRFRQKYFLELAYHFHNSVELHVITSDGKDRIVKTGNSYPYHHRMIDHHNYVFPIEIPQDGKVLVLLRSKSNRSMIFPVTIWEPDHFYSKKSRELTILGFYYGMLVVMILYNLFLFVSIRDKGYIIYSLYVSSWLVFQSGLNGLAFKYLWPENTFLANYSIYMAIYLNIFLLSFFSQVFLQTKKRQPVFYYLISFILYPWSVTGFILSILGSKIIVPLGNVGSFTTALLLMATGVSSLVKGYRPARFYVMAFSMLFIGTALLALRNFGIIPSNMI